MKTKHNHFVVFLDVDGVLNTRTTCQHIPDGYTGIHDARVSILANVINTVAGTLFYHLIGKNETYR